MLTENLMSGILHLLEVSGPSSAEESFSWFDFWPVVTGVIVFAWAVREWIYGGSVLRVKFELGYTDGIQSVRAAPQDFTEPGMVGRHIGRRITNPALDVAVITVINRGRTAATVLHPGLRFAMSGVAPVFIGGMPLGDLGEPDDRVRVEAHDSCVFVMPLGAMVRMAMADTDFQKAQGTIRPLYARAQITSGTGRVKRSRRFTRLRWRIRDGRWAVRLPLRGRPLKVEEELVDSFLRRDARVYDQFIHAGVILGKIRGGESDADIINWATSASGDLLTVGMMTARARHLIGTEPSP